MLKNNVLCIPFIKSEIGNLCAILLKSIIFSIYQKHFKHTSIKESHFHNHGNERLTQWSENHSNSKQNFACFTSFYQHKKNSLPPQHDASARNFLARLNSALFTIQRVLPPTRKIDKQILLNQFILMWTSYNQYLRHPLHKISFLQHDHATVLQTFVNHCQSLQ